MEWKGERIFFMSCGKEKEWNGNGMESRMEIFHKSYREWKVEWYTMESGKEIFYLCFVEWKNNGMESGMGNKVE